MAKLSWLCPKVLPDLFGDADDAERQTGQLNFLVQGIDVGEQLVHDVLADDADAGVVLVIGVVDVAALLHFFAPDIGEAGGHAVDGESRRSGGPGSAPADWA